MTSQRDLDQGGISRQQQKLYMGPSVGWVYGPGQSIFPITAVGTYVIDPSISLVTINVAALVTVVLPSCVVPPAGAQALPGLFVKNPITVVDVGGNALTFHVTIQPNNVSETIMGLTSIQISVNYGGFTLLPNSPRATWNSISP